MPKNLKLSKKQLIIGAVVIIAALVLYFVLTRPGPLPEDTTYKGADVSFSHPRTLKSEEYDSGVVTIGTTTPEGYLPLINVVRYQNDRDVALPASFNAFVTRQAAALCGSDNSIESITCSAPVFEPYTSVVQSVDGQKLTLTMTRRNLETGAVTTSDYGPIYVFDISKEPDVDETRRYRAVFIYPALAAVLKEVDTTALLDQIMGTLSFDHADSGAASVE
jgi:hypothetical protein